MKKLLCALVKLFAVLAMLGALAYAAVIYWDKVMELVCRIKGLLCRDGEGCCCCCDADETADYADWDE